MSWKKQIDDIMDYLKSVVLRFGSYKKPQKYWDTRWGLGLKRERSEDVRLEFDFINNLIEQYGCQNILEIGCGGKKSSFHNLKGYMGFDFSLRALKKSGLKTFIYGDICDPNLPIPDKSFDAVMTRAVLMHISFSQINFAVDNICRIATKLIILREAVSDTPIQTHFHCFLHNLPKLFEKFEGKVIFQSNL